MSLVVPSVRAGDLITADFMNQLIAAVNDLETRLAQLEGITPGANGAVAITNVSPSDLHVGDPFTIIGLNFGTPSLCVVTFNNGNPVTAFKAGSDDTHLLLNVPPMSLGTDPQPTSLVVSNGR